MTSLTFRENPLPINLGPGSNLIQIFNFGPLPTGIFRVRGVRCYILANDISSLVDMNIRVGKVSAPALDSAEYIANAENIITTKLFLGTLNQSLYQLDIPFLYFPDQTKPYISVRLEEEEGFVTFFGFISLLYDMVQLTNAQSDPFAPQL